MIISDVLDALDLPYSTKIDRRIPKKMLVEHATVTPADKRLIYDSIDDLSWVAVLKPTTVGIASYQDDIREVQEIAVLTLTLRGTSKSQQLIELVHRSIPYHLVLVIEQSSCITISLAQKRWSYNSSKTVVVDGDIVSAKLEVHHDESLHNDFLSVLALARQPRQNLMVVYQSWLNAVFALNAAYISGMFHLPLSHDAILRQQEALMTCIQLSTRIAHIHALAKREKQMVRLVDLNHELKILEQAYIAAREQL